MWEILQKLDGVCLGQSSCMGCPFDGTGLCVAIYDIREDVAEDAAAQINEIVKRCKATCC